jgi:galactokinase
LAQFLTAASVAGVAETGLVALRDTLANEARGFFGGTAPIFVGRAPGRLDVMGGVADYSGSVVLESPIADATFVALQRRGDQRFRVWTTGAESSAITRPLIEWSVPDFFIGESLGPAAALRRAFGEQDARWVGYVLGAFFVLLAERELTEYCDGADVFIRSTVPIAAGVSSSAALEVATMAAVEGAYGLDLGEMRFARLCQLVENHVVGAPCGIMDQVTCALGESGALVALRCQPHELLGYEKVPDDCLFVGLDSGVKHSVGAGRYVRARVGAFMALKVITDWLDGDVDPGGYLCNLTPAQFRSSLFELIPARLGGRDFLNRYGKTDDSVTAVDPDVVYSPRACAEHAIYENHRAQRFAELLRMARPGERSALERAGKLMYGSHWSYGSRIGLGSPETSLLASLARERAADGVLGARITGGGSGGTVALMLARDGRRPTEEIIAEIAAEYRSRTGIDPRVIAGTSPGARQWGVRTLD